MFGYAMKTMRIANGMTKKELGTASNVSPGLVLNWERNEKEPSLKTLERVCNACHFNMSDLFKLSEYHDSLIGTKKTELEIYRMVLLEALFIRENNVNKLRYEQHLDEAPSINVIK